MGKEITQNGYTTRIYDTDNRLVFKDGRLFTSRTPYENGQQVDHTELVDVTEEVLNALLREYDRQRAAAYQRSIVEQLKG